jgi:exopolysaccharide biosynthesis polyprenyl glycosylphosphotransferase
MATSEFWQRVATTVSSTQEWPGEAPEESPRGIRGTVKMWMVLDTMTIFVSVALAIVYEMHTGPIEAIKGLFHGTLIHGRSIGILLVLLSVFAFSLLLTSRRLQLYAPTRLTSFLHEQRLSVQACLTSGLLLTGTLYLVHAEDIPRSIVLLTVGLVVVLLSLRRLFYRILLYRRFEHGVGTRNVLIVGNGPEAHALRHHLESIRHLGYTFKGFIDFSDSGDTLSSSAGDVVGTLDTLFQNARKKFVDEIFFTTPCERSVVQGVLEKARAHGVDLRIVPDMYDGLTWNSPIEYIGQFPTIPLYRGRVPEVELLMKRGLDIVFSTFTLLLISPILLVIGIAVKLDSKGPVFYASERIGKKGRVFRCFKFRTMVSNAEKLRAKLMDRNEREGVLFKITDDPRVTRIGRILRKYSLDELPQFFNVLRGDMSVVGPRPPIASEVKQYKLSHLRRLDVMPGITGLWQVQGRRDPSFDSYISLDVTYIENWSIWLDLKIIVRTVGVVFSGTGS